ncbi:UPF0575 protein C19orf67 homolog isoform X2 [Alligator mississippiensis]|uniref:UPF0575 protein C19orf67 homolog isoform X2 n=1 Tax=Alligator mississippiensis TaxID=8496 RepID=UPI0009073460|nr:UPF0575 protein C19orf67 homolog isoform X2 [Alligator mississippiensis]
MGTPLGVGALPGPSPAGGDGPGAAGQGWVSPGGSGSPPPTLDELLTPLSQKLQYLLRKVEDFQSHLLYRDRMRQEQFARAVPTLLRLCQPYFHCLEAAARSPACPLGPAPDAVRTRLLEMSEQLAARLEQLVLMYASFRFVSLEDTDPASVSCFFCGRFWLGPGQAVSIFRYCLPAPYTARPGRLYKRMRWNVDSADPPPGSGSAGRRRPPCTDYYFLCCQDAGSGPQLWAIGRWVPLEPDAERSNDVLHWVLCTQPVGDFKPLLSLGVEEPSHTTATNLLVQLLSACPGPGPQSP